MYDGADRCRDRKRKALDERVRSVYEFDLERPDADLLSGLDAMKQHVAEHIELRETFFCERERESRRIDRQIKFPEDPGQCADMVFVAV